MATVRDLADETSFTDKSLVEPSIENAGNPNGSVTPEFSGQILLDTTNNMLWRATDLSNDSWVAHTSVTQDVVS